MNEHIKLRLKQDRRSIQIRARISMSIETKRYTDRWGLMNNRHWHDHISYILANLKWRQTKSD